DVRQHGVRWESSCNGRDQEQRSEDHNRDVRGTKARMNPGEDGREVAAVTHGKGDAGGVQHVGAEIAVGGDQRAGGNDGHGPVREEAPSGIDDGSRGRARVRDSMNDEVRSEEHTSELQSRGHLVCRLLLEKKKNATSNSIKHKVTVM